jgi:hypothetical protein
MIVDKKKDSRSIHPMEAYIAIEIGNRILRAMVRVYTEVDLDFDEYESLLHSNSKKILGLD